MKGIATYSPEIGESILTSLESKGWLVYEGIAPVISQVIKRGPTKLLSVGIDYFTFPATADPTDPDEVIRRLEELCNEDMYANSIRIDGEPQLWRGFELKDNIVKPNFWMPLTEDCRSLGYAQFLSALQTLTDAKYRKSL